MHTNLVVVTHVNSPALRNAKKPKHAAHSINLSNVFGLCDQTLWRFLSKSGVIGSRLQRLWSGELQWIPFKR